MNFNIIYNIKYNVQKRNIDCFGTTSHQSEAEIFFMRVCRTVKSGNGL